MQLTHRVTRHSKPLAGCGVHRALEGSWHHQQRLEGAHALMTRVEEASAGAVLGLAGPFMGRACSAGAFPAA